MEAGRKGRRGPLRAAVAAPGRCQRRRRRSGWLPLAAAALGLAAGARGAAGGRPGWHPREFEKPKGAEGGPPAKPPPVTGPDDPRCHTTYHTDYDGPAVTWGLDYKVADAGECCQRCIEHEVLQDQPGRCNSWVFCPGGDGTDECWSPDIWNHTIGECWLKVQVDPHQPAVNHQGYYAPEFRAEHKTAPPEVAWTGGLVFPEDRL